MALLMLAMTACAGGGGAADTTAAPTTTSPTDTAAEPETTADPTLRENAKDGIPADLKFAGETVRIIYRDATHIKTYNVIGTENIGDFVTDSVWARNRKVEERLGVTLDIQPTANGDLKECREEIKTALLSGVSEADFYIATCNSSVQASINQCLYDLGQLKYIDLNQPWWWMGAIEELSVDGETYPYLIGDIMLDDYFRMGTIYYNKNLYEAQFGNPDELYNAVLDGSWTLERLAQISEQCYTDLNGDQRADESDRYGFIISKTKQESDIHFLIACDLTMYTRNADEHVQIDMNNERMLKALDELKELYTTNAGAYTSTTGMDASSAFFANGGAIFYPSRLSSAVDENLRKMEAAYGILPYPKLDAAQEDYVSLIHSSSCDLFMPNSVPAERLDMVGAVIEAMAAESYRSVVPAFLDSALKVKYSRDELSGQVIDMVIAGANKNFVFEYSPQTNNIISNALDHIYGKASFSSTYSALAKAAQKSLDRFVDSLQPAA